MLPNNKPCYPVVQIRSLFTIPTTTAPLGNSEITELENKRDKVRNTLG